MAAYRANPDSKNNAGMKFIESLIKNKFSMFETDSDDKTPLAYLMLPTVPKEALHKGNIIASRANERWMLDMIDYTAQPDGQFNYVVMGIDVCSRHVFAEAAKYKLPSTFVAVTKRMIATYGKPQEINADNEFEAAQT